MKPKNFTGPNSTWIGFIDIFRVFGSYLNGRINKSNNFNLSLVAYSHDTWISVRMETTKTKMAMNVYPITLDANISDVCEKLWMLLKCFKKEGYQGKCWNRCGLRGKRVKHICFYFLISFMFIRFSLESLDSHV